MRPEFDVADAVVDGLEGAVGGRFDDRGSGGEPGEVRAVVAGAFDERVPGLAVRGDRGEDDRAVLVLELVGLGERRAPCSTAYANAARASGTSMARSTTPSPCAATCSARKWPQVVVGLMTEVRTKRAEPFSRTYDAVSRLPFSGPE